MSKFIVIDNRLQLTNEDNVALDEKQIVELFADNLRELRLHCGLSLQGLSTMINIPNQTLSSYENKTHTPSMIQAIKIAAFFDLTIEEFILCGLDSFPYDVVELYERRKQGL